VAILAVAAALTLPTVAANAAGLVRVGHKAANTGHTVGRTNVWFLLARPHVVQLGLPAGFPSELTLYKVPPWVGRRPSSRLRLDALGLLALAAYLMHALRLAPPADTTLNAIRGRVRVLSAPVPARPEPRG
jgi:hypothetical protein